jgi:hypothetical protein
VLLRRSSKPENKLGRDVEELERSISKGDLDALVIPGQGGELIYALDSANSSSAHL